MISPKLILMPLSTSGHVTERLTGGLAIAKYFNAHLDVLHSQIDPRTFLPNDQLGLPVKLVRELASFAGKFSQSESVDLKKKFIVLCVAQSIEYNASGEFSATATAAWHELSGLRSEIVAEKGKVADLIIIPQSKDGKSTSTFEASVMRSGKPILLVPRALTTFNPNTVVVGWNASTEAARTLSFSLPLLKSAQKVIIATSAKRVNNNPNGNDVVQYLLRHGIDSQFLTFDTSKQSTAEPFLSFAHRHAADLLITGAFTHRRLHEQIFGGVTSHMLAKTKLPILMAH